MARMFYLIFAVFSAFFCGTYSAVVVNNVTMPTDALSELFFNEIRNNLGLINISVPQPKVYNRQKCVLGLREILAQFPSRKVLPFFDAWGKFPSGIMKGNIFDVGSFDQCVQISVTLSRFTGLVNGQYCFAAIPLVNQNNLDMPLIQKEPIMEARGSLLEMLRLFIGICVPDSCSPQFLTEVFKLSASNAFNGVLSGVKVLGCTNGKKPEHRAVDILSMTVFWIMMGLMILSSIYEFLVKFFEKSPEPFLLAFSVISNGKKLFAINTNKSPDTIDCLTGIRVFSMIWVMYGHTFSLSAWVPMINTIDVFGWKKQAWSMHVINATVSVDSFFFIGGLLVAWLGFRELDKTRGKLNIVMMYVHRYIRLTPALAAGLLFLLSANKLFGTGPFRQIYTSLEKCDGNNWWPVLLYIQNYYIQDTLCFPQAWYLAIDFQLYILSPLLLIPMWRLGKKFVPVLVILSLLSIGCVMATYFTEGYTDLKGTENAHEWEKTYIPMHTRYSPWLVGFGLGYFMHINRGRTFRLSKLVQLLGWIVSFTTIVSIIFAPYFTISSNGYGTVFETAMYESLKRVSWAIGLAWITFACHFGFGGVVDSFLSHPFWQPLSRLTYALYLVHITVLAINYGNMRTEIYFSNYSEILRFWQTFGTSLLAAIPLSLAFEAPVLVLEKLIFRKSKTGGESGQRSSQIAR